MKTYPTLLAQKSAKSKIPGIIVTTILLISQISPLIPQVSAQEIEPETPESAVELTETEETSEEDSGFMVVDAETEETSENPEAAELPTEIVAEDTEKQEEPAEDLRETTETSILDLGLPTPEVDEPTTTEEPDILENGIMDPPAAPIDLGWNLQSQSATPNEGYPDTLDLYCNPLGPVFVNDQPLANNWTEVSGTRYIRHNIRPDGSQILLTGSYVTSVTNPDDINEIATLLNGHGSYADHYTGWGSFGMGEGVYQTRVRAFVDTNLNGSFDLDEEISDWSNSCMIGYDITAPTLTVNSPSDGDVFIGIVTMDGNAQDTTAGINTVTVRFEHLSTSNIYGPYTAIYEPATGNWNYSIDTDTLPEGAYELRFRSLDNAGNITENYQNASINNPPEATPWYTPTAPAFFTRNGGAASSPVDMYFVENPDLDIIGYQYQYIRIRMSDSNLSTGTTMMTIDCSDANNPTPDVCHWTPTLNTGVRNVHRFRAIDATGNYGAWSNWDGDDISTFNPTDFEYSDYATGIGIFGLASYIPGNGGFVISEQNDPTSTITAPADGELVNEPTLIEYSATDVDTAIKQVTLNYSYEDSPYTPWGISDTGSFLFDFPDGDGMYCFNTVAEDIADDLPVDGGVGNIEISTGLPCEIQIQYDSTKPILAIDTPVDDSLITGTFTVAGSASDAQTGIQDIQVNFHRESDHVLVATYWATYDPITETWTIDIDSTELPDDVYQIIVRAQDNAGNTEFANVRRVEIDNTPPDIPDNLGFNTPPGDHSSPRPPEVTCGGATNASSVSHHWSDESASGAVKYVRQWQYPDGSTWHGAESWDTPYTNYRSWGGSPGTQGTWNVRVMAIDEAGNESDWSGPCAVTYELNLPVADELPDTTYMEGDALPAISVEARDNTESYDSGLNEVCYSVEFLPLGSATPVELIPETCEAVPGNPQTYTWNVTQEVVDRIAATYGVTLSGIDTSFLHEGTYSIEYYVTDLAGNRSDANPMTSNNENYDVEYVIENVKPDVVFGASQTINEDTSASFTLSFTDPSYIPTGNAMGEADDAGWTVEVNYGEGAGYQLLGTYTAPTSIDTFANYYENPGTYSVGIRVCEDDAYPGEGACTEDTVIVTVNNVIEPAPPAPIVNPQPAPQQQVDAEVLGEEDTDEEETEEENTEEEGKVLGEITCDTESEASGYVYYDQNGNDKRDDGEGGLTDITVRIYAYIDGNRERIATATTDADGYWTTDLCPGSYEVEIDEEDLPDNTTILGDAMQKINIQEDNGTTGINFVIESPSSLKTLLMWILAILLLILLIVLAYLYWKSRKDKKEYAQAG